MKKYLIAHILFLYILSSCNFGKLPKLQEDKIVSDNLILIDLEKSIQFNWNLDKSIIEEDDLFLKIKNKYDSNRNFLISKISDTTETGIYLCKPEKVIKKGHLAFLLIDKIEKTSYLNNFNIQLDSFDWDCPHPNGLLEFINNKNDFIIKQLSRH